MRGAIWTAKMIKTGRGDAITVEVPLGVKDRLADIVRQSNGYLTISMGKPHKPRTAGKHSQNNLIHGWARAIAVVLGMTEEQVYQAAKRMAVSNGYPTHLNQLDGAEEPIPLSEASTEEAEIVIKTIEVFAGQHDIALPGNEIEK